MRSPIGMMVSVDGVIERRVEITKWMHHPWFQILWKLNADLSLLDPQYTLVQCKEKFGGLRYYYRASNSVGPVTKQKMGHTVRAAIEKVAQLERQRMLFDRVAPKPEFNNGGLIEW